MADSNSPEGYVRALNLTVSLCLTYTLCIACVRIWIRKGVFGVDDLIVFFATLATLGHTGCSYAALADGLGKPWAHLQSETDMKGLNGASVAGVVTFILALYVSKIGVLAFLSRITKNRSQLLAYYFCYGIVGVFGVMSVLIVTVDCPSESGYYWSFYEDRLSCPSKSVRWQVVTGLDVATEIGLLALPIQLVWALQMPRFRKAILLLAFYLRLPVIGLSLGRNYYTLQLRRPTTDPGLDSALVLIWIEIQLAYALAASTLSALKAFTESFNSGFGLGFTRGKSDSNYALSGLSGKSNSSSATEKKPGSAIDSGVGTSMPRSPRLTGLRYEDLDLANHARAQRTTGGAEVLKLRPEAGLRSFASASAGPSAQDSVWMPGSCTGSGSESSGDEMVIMRETDISVQHDQAPMLRREGMRA